LNLAANVLPERLGRSPVSTDLFQILKARHACRNFDGRSVPDDLLRKLADAAHRAPTGGNIPYRFVILVKDPIQLRMLKTVSPGHFGDSSAAIVVCTNLKPARQEISGVDAEQCSLYDAGAAAENVSLAACALGLGTSFIKSYSETGMKRILGLPEECRTELVVSVGYPTKDEPKPRRKNKEGKITYLDKYAQTWNNDNAGQPSLAQTERLMQFNTLKNRIFEMAVFLLTSAQISLNEPQTYPSLRLLDAAGRLTNLYSKDEALGVDEFLFKAREKIDANKHKAMASEKEFAKFIDEMVVEFSDELQRRYSVGRNSSLA
jgi:nitroreductase